jgi:hypothetical protein
MATSESVCSHPRPTRVVHGWPKIPLKHSVLCSIVYLLPYANVWGTAWCDAARADPAEGEVSPIETIGNDLLRAPKTRNSAIIARSAWRIFDIGAMLDHRFHETDPLQLRVLVRKMLPFRGPHMIRILEAPD